jgi:hypothetical protein
MTPKEKAKDLVDKYLDIDSKYEYLSYSMAKQCALIAVDEILEWPQVHDLQKLCDYSDEFYVRPSRYWTEVKEEIEQL